MSVLGRSAKEGLPHELVSERGVTSRARRTLLLGLLHLHVLGDWTTGICCIGLGRCAILQLPFFFERCARSLPLGIRRRGEERRGRCVRGDEFSQMWLTMRERAVNVSSRGGAFSWSCVCVRASSDS